jgi:nucleotide-binding universal stress UspA family protein
MWTAFWSLVLAAAVVVVAIAAVTFARYRRPWRLRCPRDGVLAQVQVDALAAARMLGRRRARVEICSHRGGVAACEEACLTAAAAAWRPLARGAPPLPVTGPPTILVPLDGTRGSEGVLPTVRALAKARGARVRLLRVLPAVTAINDEDEHVIAYTDQEAERAVGEARDYLERVGRALAGLEVAHAVRFGEPAEEILREAEEARIGLIAMAVHRGSGLRRLLARSVTGRVERGAWVPVIHAPYAAA